MTTDALVAVVSVVPIWNKKIAAGLDWALRVRMPVKSADELKQ